MPFNSGDQYGIFPLVPTTRQVDHGSGSDPGGMVAGQLHRVSHRVSRLTMPDHDASTRRQFTKRSQWPLSSVALT